MTRFDRSHDMAMLAQARRIATVTLAALALGAPTLVAAQTQQPAPKPAVKDAAKDMAAVEAAFKRADANSDGKLSKAEAANLPTIASRFDELDKDKDGVLNLAEFAAGHTAG